MGPVEPPPSPRVEWDATGAVRPGAARPATPRRRRMALLASAAVVLALVAVVVVLLPGGAGPPQADRYALDEVAQRYRALGSSLLADALSCAPLPPGPGQAEAVSCSFGSWSLLLVTHADRAALDGARARATTRGPDAVRWAATAEPDATVVLSEDATGSSSAYWDAADPRPVSATAAATALPLPDLLTFVETRGLPQDLPDLPGPAFRSGALWALAEPHVGAAPCRALPAAEHMRSSAEEVMCDLPGGVEALFVRDRNAAEFERNRAGFQTGTTTVPGTLRSTTWQPPGRSGPVGVLLTYVYADGGFAQLYADDPTATSWMLWRAPAGRTPDELRAVWDAR